MSVTRQLSDNPDRFFKKSLHRRNDSGELDVFEAARYFSGYNEVSYSSGYGSSLFTQKIFKEDGGRRGGRMSLDLPIRTNVVPLPQQPAYAVEKQIMKEKKHRQQPSSPGGRLASFLNSLFSQSASKKKKKSKNSTNLKNEDHESPTGGGGGGRKRRSSLSTLIDSQSSSIYSSSSRNSGFRTPPAANCTVQTPTKNYKELRSYLDQKRPVSKNNFSSIGSSEKGGGKNNQVDKHGSEEKEMRRIDAVDEGAESDSSSDLFELRIYDLDCYSSSGLPVYETTNIQTIKRASAPPISNIGPL